MNRRELLSRLPLFLLAIPVVACVAEEPYPPRPPGGGGGGGADPAPDAGADAAFTVANQDDSGHAHALELRCTSLQAGQASYTATGAHTHVVNLTADDIAEVLAGRTVTVTSTAGHPHTWVIAMPASRCP